MGRHSRREFLRLLGLGAAGAMALPRRLAAEAAKTRPNIVFILTDDLG